MNNPVFYIKQFRLECFILHLLELHSCFYYPYMSFFLVNRQNVTKKFIYWMDLMLSVVLNI